MPKIEFHVTEPTYTEINRMIHLTGLRNDPDQLAIVLQDSLRMY